MRKYENPTFKFFDNLAIIVGFYLGFQLWDWYQRRRAQYLFIKAYKMMLERNRPYWEDFFQRRVAEEIKEELNEP